MPPDMVLLSHDIQHVSHAYLSFIDTNVNVPTGVELTNSMVSTTSVGAKVANNSSSTMAVSVSSGGGSSKAHMRRDFLLEIYDKQKFLCFLCNRFDDPLEAV
jgi:hypothetical protein